MKKGFTLVELLAVISVISLLLIIIVPRLNDTLSDSKKNMNKNSAKGIVDAANVYYTKHFTDNPDAYYFDGVTNIYGNLNHKGTKPDMGSVIIKATGEIEVRVKFEEICFYKSFTSSKVVEGDVSYCDNTSLTLPN